MVLGHIKCVCLLKRADEIERYAHFEEFMAFMEVPNYLLKQAGTLNVSKNQTYTSTMVPWERGIVIEPDSKAWFAWLAAIPSSFSFGCFVAKRYYHFTARKEHRGQRTYWYAYEKWEGKVRKAYLGKTEELTSKLLEEKARQLAEHKN